MVNEILQIEVEGKVICSKPLQLENNLNKIRKILMKRVQYPFVFLDDKKNYIEQEDEEEFLLSQIKDGNIIRLKKVEQNLNSLNSINIRTDINVFSDDNKICSINCLEDNNLIEARKLISNSFDKDFLFLDSSLNFIEKEDEEYFKINKILINGVIKIKINSTSLKDSPPPILIQKESDLKKKEIDFSKYEIIKKRSDLTIYKYSNKKSVSQEKLVFQYFFDDYEAIDYDSAYVVLFCGKTGDGKSTAINAFFNIIKGVELKDNYRFLLITEVQKPKGQAESQTDGVHLYYLKDYNDKPIIIIDSQGFGDTRGLEYDQKINDAFEFVFSQVINHINTVCFISKANTNRLDICTRYIFNSVTCLFAENITENFIVIPTFATKDTISDGPAFIESIKTDADFLKIQDRMNDKWWYALDSKSVLDNEEDKITKYSFEQMKELYETKIKKLPPKGIKQSAEVLKTRIDLRIKVNLLSDTFQNLMMEQGNLNLKNKKLEEISTKISDMETRIKNFENDCKALNPSELEKRLSQLNEELNEKLNNLNNEVEEQFISSCEYGGDYSTFTHCENCKRNCHNYCDCNFQILGRCKVFTFGILSEKICEECNCPKTAHKNDHYHWVKKRITSKKDNSLKIEEERQRNNLDKKRYLDEINMKKNTKNKLNKQLNELNYNKEKLIEEKNKNLNEKIEIEKKISNTNNQITYIIFQLKNISDKIDNLAMNPNNIKTEDEYIDSLKKKMDEIGYNDEEQRNALDTMKKQNKIYSEIKKRDNLSDKELADLLGVKFSSG